MIIECTDKKNNDAFKSLQEVFKKVFKSDPSKQRLMAGTGANSRVQRVLGEMGTSASLKVS